jgi:hypothetical protein
VGHPVGRRLDPQPQQALQGAGRRSLPAEINHALAMGMKGVKDAKSWEVVIVALKPRGVVVPGIVVEAALGIGAKALGG